MRTLRTLVATGLAVTLLAIPTLSSAQSEATPAGSPVPLARQPDGRLPLEGTPWRLVAYRHDGRDAAPGPEVAAFIQLGAGRFDGSGGCARVAGAYGVKGAALRFDPRRATGRDCAENLAIVQQAVERGLRQVAAYAIEPGDAPMQDQLVLYSVSGDEVLRYRLDHLAPLEGAAWRLVSYTMAGQVTAAVAAMPGLLTFLPDTNAAYKRRQSGPLSGTTGCNGLVAEFYRRSDVLSFSELDLTDAPCTDELADQEAAMIAVLDAPALRLTLPPDRLILTATDSDERLEFVSQIPLEGTTWWLRSTAVGGSLADERYTLRLEDGALSGEGPCGPYTGSYVADGAFITFADIKGARDAACDQLRTEQALISGLRRSVTIDRRPDRLSFLDATGATTLAFGRPFAP